MSYKNLLIQISILTALLFIFSCGQNTEGQSSNPGNEQKDDVKITKIPVEALIVQKKLIKQYLSLSGALEPLHSVDIVSEVSGKVKQINKKLGDAVTSRSILAVIDDKIPLSCYNQAKSQVLSAENNLKIAQLNLKSDKELLENGDISQLAYENSLLAVKTAEANHLSAIANLSIMEKGYQDTRIMSPIKGLISRKYVELGTMVNPNMPLYHVVDLTILKIQVGIPQDVISYVNIGSPAKIKISALKGREFDGSVRFISPQADGSTGSFTAEIHIKNSNDLKIRAGMTAKIALTLTSMDEQLVIPYYALVSKNGDKAVYKIENETAQLTDIFTVGAFGSHIVVSDGLAEGDTIVVVGMKNLGLKTKVWIETIH